METNKNQPVKLDTLIEMTMEEIVQERKNAKAIAFEDVMRGVRLLAGWGLYDEFIKRPGDVFNMYDDMSIEELHKEKERLDRMASKYVNDLHPQVKTIFRTLKDDEQDCEDDLDGLF